MQRAKYIQLQLREVATIQHLTAALEGVSSIRVAQIKDKVVPGRECFDELWQTYLHLRIDPNKHKRFMAENQAKFTNNKSLSVIVSSEGNLSGTIDQQLIDYFLAQPDSKTSDVIVLGSHGVTLLQQKGINPVKTYPLPDPLTQIEMVQEIGHFVEDYAKIVAYYQSYVSLNKQVIRTIDLISAVSTLGANAELGEDVISSHNYLFEPSLEEIIQLMESTMLQIALREVLLDSSLAQQASRFGAMVLAEDKAKKQHRLLLNSWHKAKRDESDKRLRENSSVGGFL